jgi:COMPASS component SWD3
MDFSPDGTLLATAGKDAKVRVYDETTKSIAYTMKSLAELPGHSNRVFCVKFNPTDPNMLLSGGWDNTIQIYDQRYRGPVRTLYGPHVCGETIDIRRDGYSIVTGSYRVEEAIEVFDLRMNKRSRVIPWDGTGSQEVLMYDDEGDMTGQETDNEEAKSVFTQRDQNMASDSMSQTTTTTKT